ncbi:hypothetical protein DYB28_014340 [Aphanomyces astaci]|uniref:Uncharacterized protein n=1 Tax=Aphanomyces astaci TaxID=112090 RepID=A0A9X8EE17_APHAT|nr:hypothetical protein DYB28_014340 [Aphanomyces astaci]
MLVVEYLSKRHSTASCTALSDTTVHIHLSSTKPDDIDQLDTLFEPCSPILIDSSCAMLEADLYYPFEWLAQANDYSSYGLMGQRCRVLHESQLGDSECNYQANFIDPNVTSSTVVSITMPQPPVDVPDVHGVWVGQNSASTKGIVSALSYLDVDKAFTEVFKQAYNISTAQTESCIATNREKILRHAFDVSGKRRVPR